MLSQQATSFERTKHKSTIQIGVGVVVGGGSTQFSTHMHVSFFSHRGGLNYYDFIEINILPSRL